MSPQQQEDPPGDYPKLAAAVKATLKKRNLTENGAHQRCNVSRASIKKLTLGHRVELEVLEKFARCLGADPAEWRRLAGYDPAPATQIIQAVGIPAPGEVESGHQRFVRGLAELSEEIGRPIPVSLSVQQAREMTVQQAEETLAVLRHQAEEGLY